MMQSARVALAAAALLLAAPPVSSQPADPALTELRARDQQLFAIGWRLAAANAPFCESATPALGLSVLDAGGFADPAAVRRQLGLSADLAVGAVAPGSPAATVGLAANDTLLAIGDVDVMVRYPSRKPAWQRLVDVTAALDAAAAAGPVALTIARSAERRIVAVSPVQACPTRFEVLDSGGRAMAEGTRVIFGKRFPGFSYPEPEFAAAVAHEFAHNLLRHRQRLGEAGRSLGNVRVTEREADRLMPWLLANAGIAPGAATTFMERWGPRHDGGLFRNRNHEGWNERAAAIRAEITKVEAFMTSEGKADWARHFTRETLEER